MSLWCLVNVVRYCLVMRASFTHVTIGTNTSLKSHVQQSVVALGRGMEFYSTVVSLVVLVLRTVEFAYDLYGLEGRIRNTLVADLLARVPQWLMCGLVFIQISVWHKILGGNKASVIQRFRFMCPFVVAIPCAVIMTVAPKLVNAFLSVIVMIFVCLGLVVGIRLVVRIVSAENFNDKHGHKERMSVENRMLQGSRKRVMIVLVPIVFIGILTGALAVCDSSFNSRLNGYRVYVAINASLELGFMGLCVRVNGLTHTEYQITHARLAAAKAGGVRAKRKPGVRRKIAVVGAAASVGIDTARLEREPSAGIIMADTPPARLQKTISAGISGLLLATGSSRLRGLSDTKVSPDS